MYIKTKKKEKNLIRNTIHFGEKNLLGEYILDARYVQMPLENVQILQHLNTWRGGSPKGEDEGFNAAIIRTQKGTELLNDAITIRIYKERR